MSSFSSIDAMISKVKERFGAEHKISVMFENCISNTLNTTIHRDEQGRIFVITGDIPAMWLRDSSCQLRPFLLFAREEPAIRDIIVGLLKRQMECILIDPYANAFNESANGNGFQDDDTQMKPELWERKYEIDSLCFPFLLSWQLWKNAGCTTQFDENWYLAAHTVLDLFHTEQYHEEKSPYRFQRHNCVYTDTLSRDGKGALVKSGTGLIWSGFRPSDDACTYGYLLPSNMLASVVLTDMTEIAAKIYHDDAFAGQLRALASEVKEAIDKYALVPGHKKEFYAYEVDGYGQYHIMDDANIPGLLSMPYYGYCTPDDTRYLNTRNVILNDWNPYYYSGKVLHGIGSPHTAPGCVWMMALCIQGLTSQSEEEKQQILDMLCNGDAGTNLMHESVNANDPYDYTRPWFSWANSVFCEFIMQIIGYSVII